MKDERRHVKLSTDTMSREMDGNAVVELQCMATLNGGEEIRTLGLQNKHSRTS
jgi:hypothetical protein